MPPKRCANRLLVLCASINDVTAWPFWKFLQMKKVKGVTDMAMLAFNSSGGSFEARIDGDRYTLKNYAKVKGYQPEMLESFLHRWHDPGRSYFVYGGHGMGDYIELEQRKMAIQAHELAQVFGKRRFEAVLFDACFMANLDCAYHLRDNTQYIGACEGYMWEPDTCLDYHVFNTHNASALSRFKDPKTILESIQKDYCSKAARGDFSIIDTTHVAKLRAYVQHAVMPRVYRRATFYNAPQQERLAALAEAASQEAIRVYGNPGHELSVEGSLQLGCRAPSPSTSSTADSIAMSQAGRTTKRQRLQNAIQFEHALYPSEPEDKHLIDLRSYLDDMAKEEAAMRRPIFRRRRFVEPPTVSRATLVDDHGRYPSAEAHTSAATAEAPSPSSPSASPSTTALTDDAAAGLDAATMTAQDALRLFDRVVVSHRGPQAASIYASRLGGLSLTVHDYSDMSRPVEPWVVQDRSLLREKSRRFMKRGVLAEVTMSDEIPSPRVCGESLSSTLTSSSTPSSESTTAEEDKSTRPIAASTTPVSAQVLFDYPSAELSTSATSPLPEHKEWSSYLAQIRELEMSSKASAAAASGRRQATAHRRERSETSGEATHEASLAGAGTPVAGVTDLGRKRERDRASVAWR